jgi:hypothetical protein
MTTTIRTFILRANAVYIGIAAAAGLVSMDIPGSFFGTGPAAPILNAAPHAAIGFVEAHGLAFILSVLLWRAEPARAWHLTGAAMCALLGISNLVFWQMFVATDTLPMGYLTTGFHLTCAAAQLAAAAGAEAAGLRFVPNSGTRH